MPIPRAEPRTDWVGKLGKLSIDSYAGSTTAAILTRFHRGHTPRRAREFETITLEEYRRRERGEHSPGECC